MVGELVYKLGLTDEEAYILAAYSVTALFIATGLSDALLGELWVHKSFVWSGLVCLQALVASYALIVFPKPKNIIIFSAHYSLTYLTGMFGMHGLMWLIVWCGVMGNSLGDEVWLAPRIIMPTWVFLVLTFTCALAHIVLLGIIGKYLLGYGKEAPLG